MCSGIVDSVAAVAVEILGLENSVVDGREAVDVDILTVVSLTGGRVSSFSVVVVLVVEVEVDVVRSVVGTGLEVVEVPCVLPRSGVSWGMLSKW